MPPTVPRDADPSVCPRVLVEGLQALQKVTDAGQTRLVVLGVLALVGYTSDGAKGTGRG